MATRKSTDKPGTDETRSDEPTGAAATGGQGNDQAASKTGDNSGTSAKTAKRSKPYGEQAAELADATRTWAENARAELDDLLARADDLHTVVPGDHEHAVGDAARRLPMAAGDVTAALLRLRQIAADLSASCADAASKATS